MSIKTPQTSSTGALIDTIIGMEKLSRSSSGAGSSAIVQNKNPSKNNCAQDLLRSRYDIYSLVVTLRTYIDINMPMQNNAIFDSPYYLLAMISDHIPRKSYHQHNEMKSTNSLLCQYFQAFVEKL